MINLKNKTLLVTGGSGSFGSALCKYLKDNDNIPKELIIYSRDWQKQKSLRDSLGNPYWITWIIGDIRDLARLTNCMLGVNYVIHAAAIKCIVACENNPTECLNTNIVGTQNVIDACNVNGVKKAILISTDKAVMPINTYGTSKKMAEKLWIRAGYNVCRYGNVIGSNGSVVPIFKKMIEEGVISLPVTHEEMTRFHYPMKDALEFVLDNLDSEKIGEVFIPKIPSIKIVDLCKALWMPYHIVGIRPGEKLHEYMVPPDEITGDPGYSSGNNSHFLTVDEIRESIKHG